MMIHDPNPYEPPRSEPATPPPVGRMPLPLGCLGMVVIVGVSLILFDLITAPISHLFNFVPRMVGEPIRRPAQWGDLVLLGVASVVSLGMGTLVARLWFGPTSPIRSKPARNYKY